MIKQAIIPLAGLGTRLLPLTSVFAKELLPINGKPSLEYIIEECIDAGIKEIILLTGYKANIIEERYKNYNDIVFKYSRGKVEDRTGRRLLNSFHLLDDNFLLLYGDNYWPLELNKMTNFFIKMKSMDGVRLPGERRHKNRLDKGPRHINTDLVNKIKTLSK